MQICCAGEVMVELAALEASGRYQLGFAGDSYNTAVYMARMGLAVDYLTRLGDDLLSRQILQRLAAENIGTGRVTLCQGRSPGLYMIDNDADGERHFSYWRGEAPARELFDAPVRLPDVDVFYFTGITLAITRSGIEQLQVTLEALAANGCRTVFDPNYRPALWDSAEQAREHVARILPYSHTVMPTLDDERQLWGHADAAQVDAFYADHGVSECVIKGDALVTQARCDGDYARRQAEPVTALDTTGAGDAFNAGYLAARLAQSSLDDAVRHAQKLAAAVVQHRGAILSTSQGSDA